MLQEAQIVFIEQPQVVDTVAEHRKPVGAQTKCKTLVALTVDIHVAQHVRMHHAAAENLQPVLALAEADLALVAAALDVDLERRLGERKERRPEAHLQIAALEKSLGVRLVPRSRLATDGLVLRTASAPSRATDAALAQLAPIADLIVEAELARTKVTDAGLATLATFTNLRTLDLTTGEYLQATEDCAMTAPREGAYIANVGVHGEMYVLPRQRSIDKFGKRDTSPHLSGISGRCLTPNCP